MSLLIFKFSEPKQIARTKSGFPEIYTIELTGSFAGDSISVYINDSLLLNRTLDKSDLKFQIARFDEESMLMIVDNRTEKVTPFNLNPEGSFTRIEKRNGKVFIEEKRNNIYSLYTLNS